MNVLPLTTCGAVLGKRWITKSECLTCYNWRHLDNYDTGFLYLDLLIYKHTKYMQLDYRDVEMTNIPYFLTFRIIHS